MLLFHQSPSGADNLVEQLEVYYCSCSALFLLGWSSLFIALALKTASKVCVPSFYVIAKSFVSFQIIIAVCLTDLPIKLTGAASGQRDSGLEWIRRCLTQWEAASWTDKKEIEYVKVKHGKRDGPKPDPCCTTCCHNLITFSVNVFEVNREIWFTYCWNLSTWDSGKPIQEPKV